MKKIIALILAVTMVLSLGLLAGCSNSGSGSSGSSGSVGNFEVPENGYDGSEVTITFYHTMVTARISAIIFFIVISFLFMCLCYRP